MGGPARTTVRGRAGEGLDSRERPPVSVPSKRQARDSNWLLAPLPSIDPVSNARSPRFRIASLPSRFSVWPRFRGVVPTILGLQPPVRNHQVEAGKSCSDRIVDIRVEIAFTYCHGGVALFWMMGDFRTAWAGGIYKFAIPCISTT